MALKEDAMIVAGIALAVLVIGYYAKKAIVDAVAPVIPYVNPADPKNVVNQGVAWLGAQESGDPNWTLGGAIYDLTHDENSLPWKLGGKIYDWTH